jgi:hypothetical protein
MATRETVKNLFKWQELKRLKLAQFGQGVKPFTAMHAKENLVSGPMIIGKAKSFYDEMKKLTSAYSLRAGCEILRNAMALDSSLF